MKAVIPIAMAQMVTEKFGKDKWNQILEGAGIDPAKLRLLATQSVHDEMVLDTMDSARKVLNLSQQQLADAFGDYWVNVYSQKMYGPYYRKAKSAKQFLLMLNWVHEMVTESLPDVQPPRFTYEEPDENTLVIEYHSKRNLIDVLVGLIKGVGRFYGENLSVTKQGPDRVKVNFS